MDLTVENVIALLEKKTPEEIEALREQVDRGTEIILAGKPDYWIPQEGPQRDAYYSEADIVYIGGRAGGGKSDLGLGLAFTKHVRTLVIRKQLNHLMGLVDRAAEINGTKLGLKRTSPPRLTIRAPYHLIDFGCLDDQGTLEAHQGIPHDLIYIDEGAQLQEWLIRSIITWCRPGPGVPIDQRCRVVIGSNPPMSDEGMWIVSMFGPWLDPRHPNPAKPGELRWYVTDQEGRDCPVDGPGVYQFDSNGLPVPSNLSPEHPDAYSSMSRTFIPASLQDNKYLGADYKRMLDNLPEPMRSAMRDGNFLAAREDHADQLIPSEWIQMSMDRWRVDGMDDAPMSAMGFDVARGGKDENCLSMRYDGWFDELLLRPATEIKRGAEKAGWVLQHRTGGAAVTIDLGGGYGDSCYEALERNMDSDSDSEHRKLFGHKGAEAPHGRAEQSGLPFKNRRAEVYYRLKEALDPGQPGGQRVTLPPDPILFGELCSIRLKKGWMDARVIELEPKKDLIRRVGKSPNRADSVVMCHANGPRRSTHHQKWRGYARGQSSPKANLLSRSMTRRRR